MFNGGTKIFLRERKVDFQYKLDYYSSNIIDFKNENQTCKSFFRFKYVFPNTYIELNKVQTQSIERKSNNFKSNQIKYRLDSFQFLKKCFKFIFQVNF